jgi:hypothetical protein
MPGWHHEGVFQEKHCKVCQKIFKPKSGIHQFCSVPCKGKWKYVTGQLTTENQYRKISGNWNRYFSRLVGKNHRYKLTREVLLRKLEEQDGKCALTGKELTCHLQLGKKCWTNASIDRIVPGGEYTEENIQLVCTAVNMWRSNLALHEFVEWCRAVAENWNGKKL